MNTFSQAVTARKNSAMTRTTNGMRTPVSTNSAVLDLFGKIGSARKVDLTKEFAAAFAENEDQAIRVLLWARDIRGGAGERETFRKLLQAIERLNPALANRLMPKIPLLGRADDLFSYQDPLNRKSAIEFYAHCLMAGEGLFFKWAPREKSTKRKIAYELRNALGMSPKDYRKFLSSNTNVVEQQMCAKEWKSINFSHVPSLASSRYQKAFGRNASEQYAEYIRELQKPQDQRNPKVKINAGAVYPYDVVKSLKFGNGAVADAQWEALPNFVGDAKILPLVDVSGSMSVGSGVTGVTCLDIAIGLGMYLSSKTSSDFKDMFMTFSTRPKIEVLKGSLQNKYKQLSRANWEMSTNLHGAFEELLRVATKGNVAPENMPDTILILSDMQFNQCVRHDDTALQMIRRKYKGAGYKVPNIVFWNLNSKTTGSPVKMDDKGVALVSGFSPAIMAQVLGADPDEFTPLAMMLKTIMSERYDY